MSQRTEDRRPAARRVVITGIGAITPIGTGVEGLWDGLRRRESAVRRISRFDPTPFRSHIAAQVDDFDPETYMERNRARRMERYAQFSVAASRQALDDSGLDVAGTDPERVGVQMGSALGGVAYGETQFTSYVGKGVRGVDPMLALAVFNGAASCNVAIEFGFTGPNSTNGMSCASGAIAIGDGWRMIRDGEADVVVSGGVEAPLAPLCYGAFAIIRAMSTRNHEPERASRPFDAGRDGFVMGEGAAVLVLEELEHARARGARIYAEVLGYGAPAGRGAGRAGHAPRHGAGRHRAGGRGLDQRARLVHPAQRQHGEPGDPRRAGRARGPGAGERHQGVPRALPGRHGGHRGGRQRPGHPARLDPPHAQPGGAGRRVRPALRHR
jgi:3-oxoacyl-[acyl-carrier-protein] synthase II